MSEDVKKTESSEENTAVTAEENVKESVSQKAESKKETVSDEKAASRRNGGRGRDRNENKGRSKGRGRGRGRKRDEEGDGIDTTTLEIARVTRVVSGGRRLRFRATVIAGDRKGRVGIGTGKATEVSVAVQKASAVAKKKLIHVPIVQGTIPHELKFKHKGSRILLMPAKEGTGIIAGGALRKIADLAGIENLLGKRQGTTNKLVNAQAMMMALSSFRSEKVAGGESDTQEKETTTSA